MIATRLPLQAVNENVVDSVVQSSGKHGTGKSSSHTTKRGSQQQSAVTKKLTQELRGIIDNYVSDENMRSRAMDILTELGLPPAVSNAPSVAVAAEPAPAAPSSSSTTGFAIFAENQPPPPPQQQVLEQTSAPAPIPTSAPVSAPVSVPMTVDNDSAGPPRAIRRSARRASLVAGALVPLSVLEQLQPPEDTASIAMETKETRCEVKEVKETNGKRTRSRKAAVPAIVALTKETVTTTATATVVTTLEEPAPTAEQEIVQSNSAIGDHSSSSSSGKSSSSNNSSGDNVHGSAHKASRTTEMCSPASNRLRSRRSVRQQTAS
jgi:hypothetical protein